MIIAGIDPGKHGAIWYHDFDFDLGEFRGVNLLRVKKKERPDYGAMARDWKSLLANVDHVFIEQVGAMPGQGVTSMFSFGYVAGVAYGLVLALGLPHTFITPQRWKKIVGISGSDGDVSRRRASELLPGHIASWARKKDDGIAEAALIAWAGNQILEGKTDDNRSPINRRGPCAAVATSPKAGNTGGRGARIRHRPVKRRSKSS